MTLFFPAVLILYFIINNLRWKNGVLLVASLLFYSWGEPVWVLGMIGATAINYFAALFVGEKYSGFITGVNIPVDGGFNAYSGV